MKGIKTMDILDQYYRVYAKIDLDCIYANMENLKSIVNNHTQMVAVIKTDGYGHGAVPVALTVDSQVAAFAVATVDEAMNLRRHGITKPIYLLGFIPEGRMDEAIENNIRFAVYELSQAEKISERGKILNKKAYIHIKLDTGMGRIGFLPEQKAISDIEKIWQMENVEIEGIFTHFARADEANKESAEGQLKIYNDFVNQLRNQGIEIPIKHCSNSAGIVDMPQANLDEVRAGIILYGLYPSDMVNKRAVTVYPAMELKSHIIYLKELEAGSPVSYGGTFVTQRKTKVATIPVGYGDGYPRNLSNKGYVLIDGMRAPIIGRVCMDQFMVDVTDLPSVKEGDQVTLIGKSGNACITVEELSGLAGTFNYEFVCDIGKRIPRVYYRNKKIVGSKDYFDDRYNIKF